MAKTTEEKVEALLNSFDTDCSDDDYSFVCGMKLCLDAGVPLPSDGQAYIDELHEKYCK